MLLPAGRFGLCCNLTCYSILLLLAASPAPAQSTEVIVTGRVLDSRTGLPLSGAHVSYRNYETNVNGRADTDSHGFYSLPSLPPGTYSIRAEHEDYQAREIQAREVYVAARLETDFILRPLKEVLEPGDRNSAMLPDESAILPVLGPDLESGRSAPLETADVRSEIRQPSLSYVIDPAQIGQAPLSARNVYALLITLPGFAASQVSGRGLQISADGQRASESNYLLDGVQNNDFVNTGPFFATPPEAIEEYRVSTNSYSAEYGQVGGFIANAVTRRGGSAYHGSVYGYLDNEALDANTFQNNAGALPRTPFKRSQAGYSAGGRILKDRLFFSSVFDRLDSKSFRNATPYYYFQPGQLQGLLTTSSSPMLDLYNRFPLRSGLVDQSEQVQIGNSPETIHFAGVRPPIEEDRTLALERLDYQSPGGVHRLMGRLAISRETQPDFVYSIYQGLSESIVRHTEGMLLGYTRTFGPAFVDDLRLAWNSGLIDATRPHPEIPVLQLLGAEQSISLPSAAPLAPDFASKESHLEMIEGLTWTHGRHLITAGGGLLLRRPQYLLSYLGEGLYHFPTVQALASGVPDYYELPLDLLAATQGRAAPSAPSGYNNYSNNQFYGYVQENVRLSRRLVMNVGVRYESYGSLRNDSGPQNYIEPGSGQSIQDRLESASLQSESRSVFRPDRNNWAGRFGVSYNPWGSTVLRGGYGMFYDRPYDNLLLDARNESTVQAVTMNQAFDLAEAPPSLFGSLHALTSPANPLSLCTYVQAYGQLCFETGYQSIQTYGSRVAHTAPLESLWIDRNLRTPYEQTWFFSLQQQISSAFQLEVNHSAALARKLISTDLVNRICSLPCTATLGRLNPNPLLGDIIYRSNSGSSDYMALEMLARYRARRGFVQVAYTYSHSIDNQSDPMLSDVFNLAYTNPDTIGEATNFGMFTRQFDSRADRGSSDSDIRHNLVFYSIWDLLPSTQNRWLRRFVRNWTFAQMAAIRSGLPYTLFAPYAFDASGVAIPVGVRWDLVDPKALFVSHPYPGGKSLVNISSGAVVIPGPGQIGNMGRNSLPGPGFWNVDLSLTRSLPLRRLGESGSIAFGAAAFNAFNHSNLGAPNSFEPNAGMALYGPDQNQTQFPASLPLFPTPRRWQLQLKITF